MCIDGSIDTIGDTLFDALLDTIFTVKLLQNNFRYICCDFRYVVYYDRIELPHLTSFDII
jgi:hypothetical protein